ncbi:MAG: xanthine dehydrogenase family protein molybdopterin-binding subunit [Saprospiraceae bacterium]|nr:xanthine dehydrogenase family protein molybdopterin-binding subunit [Saprospiraceae bacterium]
MTIVKTHINRRSFFKTTAIAGGGMLLGFSWLASCTPDKVLDEALTMPSEWFNINAFLKIGENGVVTIMSPNPEIGQNVKTSMPMIVAEELDVDWKKVIVEQAPLNTEEFSRQVAGGSQSIRQGWEGLRKAGATARQMLINAAAKRWEINPADCSTSEGMVMGPNGEKIGYGEIAAEAATMDIPTEVALKETADFKIIGSDRGNVDMQGILTGQPLFGIDTRREGMKYAVALRPPAFGQKLVRFDDSAARAVSGVSDVLQFGDKIAVLANSTWAAMKGKKALVAEWTQDSPAESTADHDAKMLELLNTKAAEPLRKDGDVEKAFAEADQVLERIYEAPFLPHNCMEPMNFFADVRADEVELFGPIQTPAGTRKRVAELLGREESQVKVGMSRMGGGFGRRLYGDFALEAAEISKLSNSPIQLVFSREDDMNAGIYRPASKYKIQASIKEGKITGYKLTEVAINSHMYGLIPNFFPAGAFENFQVDAHVLESNITTGAWRAPYTNFLGSAENSFFDELATTMGVDVVQQRLDLLEQAKPIAESDERIQYSPARMQDAIRLVADKAGWGKAPEGVYQGFSAYYSHNTHVAEIAELTMEKGVAVVKKVYCAIDCGIVVNPIAAKNQAEGGIIDGIGHALFGELTFDKGMPSSTNFNSYRMIRMPEAPEVEVYFVENDIAPTGLGEPTLPPAGGAVANALFQATGKRFYKQPYFKEMEVLQ